MKAAGAGFGDRGAGFRDMPQDLERDRKVVRRKYPNGVDVGMRARPVESPGTETDDRPQFAGLRDISHRLDAGVIAPLIHDEQAAGQLRGQLPGFLGIGRHGFFDEDGNAARHQAADDVRVPNCRDGHDGAADRGQGFDTVPEGGGAAGDGALARRRGRFGYVRLAARRDEVTQNVDAPATASDEREDGSWLHGRVEHTKTTVELDSGSDGGTEPAVC